MVWQRGVYDQILYITNNCIRPKQIYVTNFCNENLPRASHGKTVLIPKTKAKEGIINIKKVLEENPTIKYIFPMSQQVNYWLQKLEFYRENESFINSSEPSEIGVNNIQSYY